MKEISFKFVASKIKESRLKKGLTQQELALAIGKKSSTYIALIETGKRKVGLEDLGEIAKALGRDVNFFIGKESGIPSLSFALRSQGLTEENIGQANEFIEFIKSKQKDGRTPKC